MQRSVVLVKPDGIQRGLVGEIIARFEKKGLKLVGLKMMKLTDEVLDEWYAHHKEKPFFGALKDFMKSSPIVAMLWEGLECVEAVRKLCGVTLGRAAEAGSIRGDFSMSQQVNLIHASDSVENAIKEERLIFDKNEIFDYDKSEYLYVYSVEERE
ncbi:nucleoside-diphosphate kinase [Candidatus Beckwithbacteria bacterium RBG_13_42_9]|uniref:Nucleoside diphosphate kinase n=1 Tax=Candidatus Beckwithbacteria bacterium RBG_13_42_9 TaxID=1797457 RepID=A0A1F5E6N9_9BACT|nr:MAG: nucleoside-diphosphate kinase [Candidatus Beckwithbacteria bacterium RBG_13_42_9]